MKTFYASLAFAICFGSTVFAAPSPPPNTIIPTSLNLRAAQAVDPPACPGVVCPKGQAVFPESKLGCECQIVFCAAVVCREDEAPGSTCYCPPLPTSTPKRSPAANCIQSLCENGSVRDPVTCECPKIICIQSLCENGSVRDPVTCECPQIVCIQSLCPDGTPRNPLTCQCNDS